MKQFTEYKFGESQDGEWDVKISIRNGQYDGRLSNEALLQNALVELLRGRDPTYALYLAAKVIPEMVAGELSIVSDGATIGYFPAEEE